DRFGFSTAIGGDSALSGTWYDDGLTGAVYAFARSGTVWTQQQKIRGNDTSSGHHFGYAVALSGDTAVVGAPGVTIGGSSTGAIYVFGRSGATWTQLDKLSVTPSTYGLGTAVDISGDVIVAGAYSDPCVGCVSTSSAHVFRRNGTTFTHQALVALDGVGGDG